ncbi:hypothetical protein [Carboxylicivirga caseinilyticus]|uniref:golvesin C-terminal-like domain-containing protein n=1 Tax=Carboxylicivirga caseinilyticus TaxID=3417572 RepID=UPI003D353E84|nr:hypothetical protein [Marinilabiliaceae bacterium A049]
MISLFNVRTIARFESKTLLRSWFFRIFSAIAIVFLLMFNMFAVAGLGDGSWPGRVLPSAVPYFNIWILNIAQSIIAIFLSADFLGRDKKLDTTEAFYVRNMSNIDYVIGKTLGILKVFFVLNVIVLAIGILFSIIGSETTVNWTSYLIYPLLISLPTLLFILGLSFFAMTLIRNQAITFVVLLGLVALSLFYLQNKFYGLIDFLGFFMPFMRSDFTGFGNETDLILVRSAFLLLGIFFILATVWRLPRLEQQKFSKSILIAGLLITGVGALAMMSYKAYGDNANQNLRAEVSQLNQKLKSTPYQIKAYNVDLKHEGEKINVETKIDVSKQEDNSGDLVLALNPGLKVLEVSIDGKNIDFERKAHLITIDKNTIVKESFALGLKYMGVINDMVMFPEVSDETLLSLNRLDPIVANKQFSFIEKDYVLLTREANWYPVVASKLYWTRYPFVKMDLKVESEPDLKVISQGESNQLNDGAWQFSPQQALNAHSVVIGNFEKVSTMVDSIEFSLYYHPKHTFFKPYFTELGDTASVLIKSMKDDFERQLAISYPFKKLSIVESPINFYSYLRNWSLSTEEVMPEMVFFPESGGGNWQNDLSNQKRRIDQRAKERNEEMSERDIQIEMFKNYLGDNFIRPRRFFFGRQQTGERSVENWGRYQIFPLYYTYTNSVEEEGYPLLTIALENYLHERLSTSGPPGGFGGLSTNDEVILKLKDRSLTKLIEEEEVNVLGNIFASKGNQLLSSFKVNSDAVSFDRQLNKIIEESQFQNMNIEEFTPYMNQLAQNDFSELYSNWLKDEDSPAFMFSNVDVWEIKEGNRIRYFVKVAVANKGDIDGIVGFTIREGERRGGRGRFRSEFSMDQTSNAKSFLIQKDETVDIGFVLDEVPRDVTVNTYLAKNIPSEQRLDINDVIKDQRVVDFFEGKRPSTKKLKYAEDFEVIVDNEDEGCQFVNTGESRTIKDWWLSRQNEEDDNSETYGRIRFWNTPIKWQPVAGQEFFGEYLKSGYYKRKGSGEGYVSWIGQIKAPGNYEVYVYVPNIRDRFRGGPGGGQRGYERDFHYTVEHDDGEEEVELNVTQDNNGWLSLGDYYFSEGPTTIKLSDQTNSDYVIADAVKWVKK